jgi:hypothetical protein
MDFNIKTKYEFQDDEEIQIIRTNVFLQKNYSKDTIPYFFIRNHLDTKNYRISISFEHLNKNFGLDIGIIRDFTKLNLNINELTIFLSKFKQVQSTETDNTFINITNYSSKTYPGTSIFIISKTFNNITSETIVYFSNKFSNINLFLENSKGE